jgi:hypothetical protein|tara:strand:+ start:632 stop:856 length:225 start_codon:yes stop_codon:yes gene_type:complete
MKENNESEKNIRDTRRSFNVEIMDFKEKAVKEILDLHPKFYNSLVDFDDWRTAMLYLEKNRDFLLKLLKQGKDD